MDRAVAQPGDDWTDEISVDATGPAKTSALETLSDLAGSYFRHPSNVQMVQLQDGRWAVSFTTDDWSETC